MVNLFFKIYLPGVASPKDHVNLKTEFVPVVFIPYLHESVIAKTLDLLHCSFGKYSIPNFYIHVQQ